MTGKSASNMRNVFHPLQAGYALGKVCATFCCSRIEGLRVSMRGKELLSGVDLHLHCGELTAIVGPNGAGKSTLLRALIGEIPYGGKVEFLDARGSLHKRPQLGYVPQNPRFDPGAPITVLDLFAATLSRFPVWLGVRAEMRQRVLQLLKLVEADGLIDRKVGVLSGGELQRVLLALALEPRPNLLLLDEPVSGMDVNGRRLFYQVVDRVRHTFDLSVLVVSHDFGELARVADRMVLLQGKVLANGTPREVFAHPSFQDLFGAEWPMVERT